MAKRIIILDRSRSDENEFKYLLWVGVPAARQGFYADPNAKSVYVGATVAENLALQNGSIAEKSAIINTPVDTTQAGLKVHLERLWDAFQAEVNSVNQWKNYGTFFDGTTWTNGGVN